MRKAGTKLTKSQEDISKELKRLVYSRKLGQTEGKSFEQPSDFRGRRTPNQKDSAF